MEDVTIICEKCKRKIARKNDLIVTNIFYYLVAYHSECFAKEQRDFSLFVGDLVINGFSGNLLAVMAGILGILVLLIPGYRLLALLSLIVLGVRAYSWLRFERYLK